MTFVDTHSTAARRSDADHKRLRPAGQLVLISFLSLYLELTLIRWVPTRIRLLAYFSNYVLIAALLGLGLGMMMAGRRRRLVVAFPPALLILTIVVLALERANFVIPLGSEGEFIWNYLAGMQPSGFLDYLILVGFFVAVAAMFILLGQEVARGLRPFASLPGYSINILGSLLGVIGFAALSLLETPPTMWFGVAAASSLLYLWSAGIHRVALLVAVTCLAGTTALVAVNSMSAPKRSWSPYYEIATKRLTQHGRNIGYEVSVNKDSHQQALDLSGRGLDSDFIEGRKRLYDLPYRFARPDNVLVVGAGTGNDVATAVRQAPDATVDAVEIDPVIARLGQTLHPEQPYANPKVHLVIDDARSYLQKTSRAYDLIVFGFLDSHRLFSQMSSVRMDNYVYTVEDFRRVRDRLTPDGLVAVTFTVHEKWIADRIFTVLTDAFGRQPVIYQGDNNAAGTTFLIGRSQLTVPPDATTIDQATAMTSVVGTDKRLAWHYSNTEGFLDPSLFSARTELLTDDWPFLYMQSRAIPPNYLLALILTLAASLLLVWRTVPSIDGRAPSTWNFFFLGAAFALLETRGITEIALVFGSTWLTNTVVIGAVLLMILFANLAASRWRPRLIWVYAGLLATLSADWLFPLQLLLQFDFGIQMLGAGLRVGLPLFFSGIIFARWFERTEKPGASLGANLIGAVMGGLLEYLSLIVGLRTLYLLAFAFYTASLTVGKRIGLNESNASLHPPDVGAPRAPQTTVQ